MRSKVIFTFGFMFFLSVAVLNCPGQEICNNGIDDDGDGRIDLNDNNCLTGIYNLIPNPSFETLGGCPDGWSKLDYAAEWLQPHPTSGSTDLYHKCSGCTYPNFGFFQQVPLPAPDGEGFAGFYDTKQYDSYGEYKEFLATCLPSGLTKDSAYRLRFYIGFMQNGAGPNATNSTSPVSISIFGTASCSDVQYNTGFRRCPMTVQGGGWAELKTIPVAGSPGQWVLVESEFVSPDDVNALVIGPACAPNINNGENYYLIDNILLYKKDLYHLPVIQTSGDICADTLRLSGSIAPLPPAFSCQWFRNGVALPGENTSQLNLTRNHYGSGDYILRYRIDGRNYFSASKKVLINDLRFRIDDSVAICNNSVLLKPDLNAIQPGCAPTYLWNDGSSSLTLETSTPGWYWFETNKNGCRFRDSVFVYASNTPVVNLGADTMVCPGRQVLLDAGDNSLIYKWQDGSSNENYLVTAPGKYFVSVSNGHCSAADTIVVHHARLPEARFLQDSIICSGEEKILSPFLYGDEFLWNTGNTSREIRINSPGLYEVTVKNLCGMVQQSIMISASSCLFFLPGAFTPNADGLNDQFGLKDYSFIREYSMRIYNRWGELVYYSNDPSAQWNGMHRNVPAGRGFYAWSVQYTDWKRVRVNRKGTVAVL